MYDTIELLLKKEDVIDVDLIAEIPCYLENISTIQNNYGMLVSGWLGGLKISITENYVKVSGGSFCKWYLGSNMLTMGRGDTERAIIKLSDILHLPMTKAVVTRIDVAENILTRHKPIAYLNHLGTLKNSTRLLQQSGLYYKYTNGLLCFYDKVREQKTRHNEIPELFKDKNVLRYELRLLKKIPKQMNVPKVNAGMLYDEKFYMTLLRLWRDSFLDIEKINDVSLNFQAMRTKRDLYKMGVRALIQQVGGLNQINEQINEALNTGQLTNKQAFDLRKEIKEANALQSDVVVKNEMIEELTKKVKDAVKFYR